MLEGATSFASQRQGATTVAPPARRLLVVDDDHPYRIFICRAAAKAGYLPAGAGSYDEATGLVAEFAFDAIALDLLLGERGGVELLRYLALIECKAPVIIVTGCDQTTCSATARLAQSLKLNVWDVIAKPIELVRVRRSFEDLKAVHETASSGPATPAGAY